MKITKRSEDKFHKLEWILALSFIVPYMEIGIVRDLINFEKDGVTIPASIFIMLVITILLTLSCKICGRKRFSNSFVKIIYLKIILDFMILMRGIYVENFSAFFTQFLWFVVPFYYAVSIMKCIDYFELNAYNVGKLGLIYFTFYICITVLINIQQYGFELSGTVSQSRLISPGGGPVILGYTIVLMMCYLLNLRNIMSRISILIMVIIFFIGGILTGSRGAIWPMMVLILFYSITNKKTKVQVFSIILFIIISIIINPLSYLGSVVPRIMNLSGGVRSETVARAIQVFRELPIINMVCGTGLSACFPYQLWSLNRDNVSNIISYNTFLYNGQVMLVQPHNSYIYLLLETGIVGLLLFLVLFIQIFRVIKHQASDNKFFSYLLLILVIVLNYFDSIFIIQPGSAGVWWVLLFLNIYHNQKYIKLYAP